MFKIEDSFPNEKEFNLQEIVDEMVVNSIAITVFDLRDIQKLSRDIKTPIDE